MENEWTTSLNILHVVEARSIHPCDVLRHLRAHLRAVVALDNRESKSRRR